MEKGKVIFRVDGGINIGWGHFFRCLAIADMIKKDFDCTFICKESSSGVIDLINNRFSVELISDQASYQEELDYFRSIATKKTILVLDGYQFDTPYIEKLMEMAPVVYIDDLHHIKIPASAIINHCGGLSPDQFQANLLTTFYLGPEYAMLRSGFFEFKLLNKQDIDYLVCFGGADPRNHTAEVLRKLPPNSTIAVVLGFSYQHSESLNELIDDYSDLTIYKGLDEDKMIDLMRRAKTAITSASTVSYEYLTVGSSLYCIQTAQNQQNLFHFLIKSQAAKEFTGRFDESFVSNKIIDRKVPERLLKVFKLLLRESMVSIRNVCDSDMMRVYEWSNDPQVRNQSFNSDMIDLGEHEKWFSGVLKQENIYYYLLEFENRAVGQIRFSINSTIAEISFLVALEFRGQGWGEIILRQGIKKLLSEGIRLTKVIGYVKNSNEASKKSFIKCNFKEEVAQEYPDSLVYKLVL